MRTSPRHLALCLVLSGPFVLAGCAGTMQSQSSALPPDAGSAAAQRMAAAGASTVLDRLAGPRHSALPLLTAAVKQKSWFDARTDAKTTSLLYVANWYGNGVEVYSQKTLKQVGHIDTSPYQPNSVHVGNDGNVWVALNTAGTDPSIYVYQPGGTAPIRTLTGVTHIPVGTALAPDGTVYVTDENIGVGEVIVFAPGSNTPTSTLHDPSGSCCGWVAVDRKGNLYFTYESKNGHTGAIDFFKRGAGKPKSLGITLGTFPGGIQVLKNGTIVVVEQGIPSLGLTAEIDTFPKGATQPSSQISGDPLCDNWVGPALDKKEQKVYVGSTLEAIEQCSLNYAFGVIEQFSYPSGTLLNRWNDGLTNQPGWTLLVPAVNPPAAGQ